MACASYHNDDDDDRDAWLDLIAGVKPLSHKNMHAQPVRPITRRPVQTPPHVHHFSPPKASPKAHNPGPLPWREQRKLRRSDIAVQARLDLHGMTLARAETALRDFMNRAWHDGLRCVEIITGRGNPERGTGQLRRHVPLWLGGMPFILHVAENPRSRGGALYVLLRRHKEWEYNAP